MLKCVAVVDGKRIDFEKQPLFLGYKPLIMGVCVSAGTAGVFRNARSIELRYSNVQTSEEIARIELSFDKQEEVDDTILILLKGISSMQQFETSLERWAFRLNQRLSKKSPGNIDLTAAEYDQLKIAYSIPREIRMVTVQHEEGANTFPIDLFGDAGSMHLVLSLRYAKKSCAQIEAAKKITIRIMQGTYAPFAYFLGRNHSANWHKAVLPPDQIGKEDYVFAKIAGDYGVHRIMILQRTTPPVAGSPEKLVHVHRAYANWHKRQGFPLKEITR